MNISNPLVSIITPCYNAELYIQETIKSVIAQSFENWELIIIDDCSTDKSADIINEFSTVDSRIKCLKTTEPSGSPSLPRNIGIENAKGQYIAFLDADDLWLPNKLENQIEFLKSNGYSFVYSDYEKISFNGKRKNREIRMPQYSSFWDIIETCSIPCLTVLMKKEIISNTRFRQTPKEDFVFWLDILKKGYKAYNTGDVLALYREQPNSRSSNKFEMIKQQWLVLRQIEGVKPIVALYFMIQYLIHGIIKYLK